MVNKGFFLCGWCVHPYCGSLASHVGSVFLSHCRRDIHSQDHGLSHTCTCTRSRRQWWCEFSGYSVRDGDWQSIACHSWNLRIFKNKKMFKKRCQKRFEKKKRSRKKKFQKVHIFQKKKIKKSKNNLFNKKDKKGVKKWDKTNTG